MSIPAQTRATYRKLLRVASDTFAGDAPNQTAFRFAIRKTFASPTLESYFPPSKPARPARSKPVSACSTASSSTASTSSPSPATPSSSSSTTELDEQAYRDRLKHWSDVAEILSKNVVQARKKEGVEDPEAPWALRITPKTELGDNASIKTPPKQSTEPFPNRRKRREREGAAAGQEASAAT